MKLTLEISMYPFNQDYLPPIKGFIDWLNQQEGLKTQTFATATLVSGDYDRVMDALREGLKWSHEQYGKAVFVTKFLPDTEALK